MKKIHTTLPLGLALALCFYAACMDQDPAPIQALERTPAQSAEAEDTSAVSCDTGCDDGDPCTEDLCAEDSCTHTLISGCTIYACNSLGTMDKARLDTLEPGELWKASGEPVPAEQSGACTDAVCNSDTPCCNTCEAALTLEVEGEALAPVVSDQNLPWACLLDECGEALGCEPLSLNAAYWLWGRVTDGEAGPEYLVQGWCLQTTTDALPGEYVGSWVSGSAEAHTVQVSIEHKGSWSISITDLRECSTCNFSVPMQFASNIAIRDGALEFDMAVCGGGEACVTGDVPVRVSLASHRDQLIGTFTEAQNFGSGFGVTYSGAVGLERLTP